MNKAELVNLLHNNYVHTLIVHDAERGDMFVFELQDLQLKRADEGVLVLFHKKVRGDKVGSNL
jgi:hypothetical protein